MATTLHLKDKRDETPEIRAWLDKAAVMVDAERSELTADLLTFGTCVVGPDGKRVPPERWRAERP